MIRVLLVDDEYYFRQSLKYLIDWQALGFEIIGEASNGQDAIEKAAEADLVLLDVNIPICNGLQVLESCTTRGYKAKIVIVTVYSEFAYIKKAIEFGAVDYLLKPLEKEELIRVLTKVKGQIRQSQGSLDIRKGCNGNFFAESGSAPTLSFTSTQRLNLLMHMRAGNHEAGQRFLEELWNGQPCSAEEIYFMMMEILSVCKEYCLENSLSFYQESACAAALQTLQNAKEFGEITAWLQTFVREQMEAAEQASGKTARTKQVVENVKAYINSNYTDPELSVTTVAKAFYLNYQYLSKLFAQQAGIGMSKYITHLRTQRAKELLEEGCLSVQGIAAKVGFSDVDYFSKCFKKAFGLTPSQYADRLTHQKETR